MPAPRKSTWQLQEAKNKLSEVIRRAREEGPQTITVRGEEAAVISAAGSPRSRQRRETHSEFFERWAERLHASGADELGDFSRMRDETHRDIDFS